MGDVDLVQAERAARDGRRREDRSPKGQDPARFWPGLGLREPFRRSRTRTAAGLGISACRGLLATSIYLASFPTKCTFCSVAPQTLGWGFRRTPPGSLRHTPKLINPCGIALTHHFPTHPPIGLNRNACCSQRLSAPASVNFIQYPHHSFSGLWLGRSK